MISDSLLLLLHPLVQGITHRVLLFCSQVTRRAKVEGQVAEFHKNSAVCSGSAASLTVIVLEITKLRPHNMRLPAHGVRKTNHRERNAVSMVKVCTYNRRETQYKGVYMALTLHKLSH